MVQKDVVVHIPSLLVFNVSDPQRLFLLCLPSDRLNYVAFSVVEFSPLGSVPMSSGKRNPHQFDSSSVGNYPFANYSVSLIPEDRHA